MPKLGIPSEIVALWPAGGVVVLRGAPGSGKSSQLQDMVTSVASHGGVALRAAAGYVNSDKFGLGLLADAIREQFEHLGNATLARHLFGLERVRRIHGTAFSTVVERQVSSVLEYLRAHGRTLLALDDVHLIADPVPLAETCRNAGCVLVGTCPAEVPYWSPLSELVGVANIVTTVRVYTDDELAEMVSDAVGAAPHETLWTMLRGSLGPLAANPRTVVETSRHLVAQGKVIRVRGRLLPCADAEPMTVAPASPLAVELACLSTSDRAVLVAICTAGVITMADLPRLAADIGMQIDQVGRALDRLVVAGLIVAAGAERLEPCCLALTASLSVRPVLVDRSPPAASAVRPAIGLSAREHEIVDLIAVGYRNVSIASRLRISVRAVERHVTRVLAKTGCRSRVELAVAHVSAQRRAVTPEGRTVPEISVGSPTPCPTAGPTPATG